MDRLIETNVDLVADNSALVESLAAANAELEGASERISALDVELSSVKVGLGLAVQARAPRWHGLQRSTS